MQNRHLLLTCKSKKNIKLFQNMLHTLLPLGRLLIHGAILLVPPRLGPYMIEPTRLSPHDCAHTRLCPHTIVSTHDCAQTRLCPHTIVPRHDCAHTRLCPHTFVPTHVCAQTHLCPDMLYLFCHFLSFICAGATSVNFKILVRSCQNVLYEL